MRTLARFAIWIGTAAAAAVLLWIVLVPVASLISPPGRWGGEAANYSRLNAARSTLITALGALALTSGLAFTARTHNLSRRGQFSDRFRSAVQLLSSDKLEERLGGIYSLEQLISESAAEHEATVNVLAGFIRSRASVIWDESDQPMSGVASRDGEHGPWRSPLDIDAAMTVLGRRPARVERFPIDMTRCDLRGVNFHNASFVKARFKQAWMDEVDLTETILTGTVLDGALLRRARVEGSKLDKASLRGTQFENAQILDSDFSGADIFKTNLTGANVERVAFRNAAMFNPLAEGARFIQLDLRGAQVATSRLEVVGEASDLDLRGASLENVGDEVPQRLVEILKDARTDGTTRMPPHLRSSI